MFMKTSFICTVCLAQLGFLYVIDEYFNYSEEKKIMVPINPKKKIRYIFFNLFSC